MGFVQADQHRQLGVVDGRHRHKAGNAGAGVLAVQLLAGAGFAAHPVAGHGGVFAGAVGDNALHQRAHDGGGLLRDDLCFDGGLGLPQRHAVGVGGAGHHIGLHQPPAVDDGRHRRDHLQVADLAALPKGTAGQLHRAHLIGGIILAACDLAGQVDAGGLPQAEGGKVVAEGLLAQPRPDLDKAGVAADRQPLGKGLQPVDVPVGAAEPGPRHVDGPGADKLAVRRAGAGVQRRRGGDQLEHAARLVQITDGLVAPLCLLGGLQGLAAGVALQRVHRGAHLPVHDGAGGVGVVVGLDAHGQDGAGVHVHHDAHRAGLHVVLLYGGGQRAFQVPLDVGVDGQRQRGAWGGFHQGAVALGHIVAPGVLGGQHPAVLAGQQVVVLQLQPPQAGVVHVGKAQQYPHKIALRVDALGVLTDLDALGAVFHAPGAHRVGGRFVHPALEQAVVGGAVRKGRQRFFIVDVQDLAQRLGGGLDQFVGQVAGRGADGPAGLAGGQQGAVGRVDLAARRRDDSVPQLLVGGAVGVAFRVQHLQNKQPGQQHAEADHRHRQAEKPGAAAHVAVLLRRDVPRRGRGFRAWFHGGSPSLAGMRQNGSPAWICGGGGEYAGVTTSDRMGMDERREWKRIENGKRLHFCGAVFISDISV